MAFLTGLLRVYSWIFETILSLAAIAVAVAELAFGGNIHLEWLPWTGNALVAWMIVLGVLGLLFVLLAIRGKMRILLFLFSAGMLVLLVKGLFLSPFAFGGPGEAEKAACWVAAAFVAMLGAWPTRSRAR